jgi:pimeloyl-ACP methyl ester carboxylesterase
MRRRELMKKSFFILSFIGLLCLTACSPSKGGSNNAQAWPSPAEEFKPQYLDTAAECTSFIASLPPDYFHDYLTVPEDPQNPNGVQIKVFYYGKVSPGQTPIVFFNGGPGNDSHGEFKLMTDFQKTVVQWKNAPFVYIDQRGNGCSSGFPQGNSDDVIARLRFYGSSGIVADAEAVRKHLFGTAKWKVFGQSYGAWIVHRYQVQAPSGMVAAFAQANTITEDPLERVTNRIYSQNRVLQQYLITYPDDKTRLETLRTWLTIDKCYASKSGSVKVCGLNIIRPLTQKFPFSPRWSWVHDWLTAMAKNNQVNETKVKDFVQKLIFNYQDDPKNLKKWGTTVIDFFDRNVPPFDRPTCEEIYRRLISRAENPNGYLLHECMGAMQFLANSNAINDRLAKMERLKSRFGTDHLSVEALKNSLQQSNNKFYLYSGQLDTMVPVENFAKEVMSLANLITYRHFMNRGHDSYYTEPQIAEDVLADFGIPSLP